MSPDSVSTGSGEARREASRDTVAGILLLIYAAISLASGFAHVLGPRAIRVQLVELGVDPDAIVIPSTILNQATWSAVSGTLLALVLAAFAVGLLASRGWARRGLRWWAILTILQAGVLLFTAYASTDTAAAFQFEVQEWQREALVSAGEDVPPGVLDRSLETIREAGTRRLATVGLLPVVVPVLVLVVFRRSSSGDSAADA